MQYLKLVFAFAVLFFALTISAEAHRSEYRVGILMLIKPDRPQLRGLRAGLRDAGYVEGENLTLRMPAVRTPEELRNLAKEMVKQQMDVLVTTGNVETNIAREITQQLPIIFMPASDPISAGFVKSLPRPETNLTGLALIRDVASYGKQLEVFKEVIPSLETLAVLYDARNENPMSLKGLAQVRKVASHLFIGLHERPIHDVGEVDKVVASLSRKSVGGVFVLCSSLFGRDPESIINRAIEKKLPLFSCGWTEQGALVSLGLDFYQIGRRAGWYVDQILKGAKPRELAVESPKKFELAINLKTANAIGIRIAPEVLQRADKIIR